ncbi:hypothetical protein [Plastoroseomonas arctica]|uniref:DUF2232 domain-containing protein n=1 Tax=Plastoroseomonas arctica TaxID=1509237 RepID=A0AAF1K2K5_9PROT|nr:hypothetical protein [Plastoroseomonas arctica]MBR0655194.1 hypothetical protein [Plastoroseomonas arctica]
MAAQPSGPITAEPRWLAAGAGGFLAAAVALWAMRGLPGGTLMLWLAPLPILAAGLSAGPLAAIGALLLSSVLLWAFASGLSVVFFLAIIGIPAALLPILAMRRDGVTLGLPMAALGIYPLALLIWAALAFAEHPGGLAGVMERMLRNVIALLDMPGVEPMVELLVRLKAALIAFWMSAVWVANAVMAQRLLTRFGMAALPAPGWGSARLPGWYAVLPALAAGFWIVAQDDPLAFSAFLILLLPFFWQGLAGVHRRAAALQGRRFVIAGYYLAMVIFLQLMAPATVALGLYDQWVPRAPRGGKPT